MRQRSSDISPDPAYTGAHRWDQGHAGCWLEWCAVSQTEGLSMPAWKVSEWIRDSGQRWLQSVALADRSRAQVQWDSLRRRREGSGHPGWPVTAGADGDALAA